MGRTRRLLALGIALAAAFGAGGCARRTTTAGAANASPAARTPHAATPGASTDEDGSEVEDDEVDEGALHGPEPGEPDEPGGHPFDALDGHTLERLLLKEPESLGSFALGSPNAGRLFNGVQVPTDEPRIHCSDAGRAFGTAETIDQLLRALDVVHAAHAGTAPLVIGHVSARNGGPLSPHKSHQAGRDADVGYYHRTPQKWFVRANGENLDVARSWTYVRALLTETDVEYIFIDHSVQALLRTHAEAQGESAAFLKAAFDGSGGRGAIVRHVAGHADHLHVRFFNPIAHESGRRLYPYLIAHGLAPRLDTVVVHKARRGETVGSLAQRYGTTVTELMRLNGLRSPRLVAGRSYRVAVSAAGPPRPPPPVRVPPRLRAE